MAVYLRCGGVRGLGSSPSVIISHLFDNKHLAIMIIGVYP